MSDDPKREGSGQPTQPSTCPKAYVSEISTPVGLRSDAHALYEAVAEDFNGRPLENLRLTFRVPPEHKASNWKGRPGWSIYRCDVSGHEFGTPDGAPVPIIAADKPRCSAGDIWLKTKIVHPDFLYDRAQLLRELARGLDLEVHDRLRDLCEAFDFLKALSQVDELPENGVDDPYLMCRDGRRGYAAVGSSRPGCSG